MISEFISILSKHSYARPSLFLVRITKVPDLVLKTTGVADFKRDMEFYCSAVDIPGTQILTTENRIYDMPQKYAYMKAHDELQLTFRVDRDFLTRKFFDAWEDSCYNRETGNVAYKDNYVGQIQILPMTEAGISPYVINVENCFPTQISNISYGWENTGQIAQFTVSFSFTKKVVSGSETLFNKSSQNVNNKKEVLDFDVLESNSPELLKNSIYSSVNTVYSDNNKQKMAMSSSQIDTSIFKS